MSSEGVTTFLILLILNVHHGMTEASTCPREIYIYMYIHSVT